MNPPDPPRLLAADDQADVLEALRLLLKGEGFKLDCVRSPGEVVSAVESHDFDCVLIDLNYTRDTTSGKEGMNLLARLRELDPTLPVVVMTAWSSVDGAVRAMRAGARDYVEKPWNNERLLSTLRTQVELGRAMRRTERLESENERLTPQGAPEFIAEADSMRRVRTLMERVGPSKANVLITGEHGTGKEVVARWLYAASPRADEPFIAVNAGGFSEGLFESELFGHVKGAFTDARSDRVGCFELADGGTLFLDEIANISPSQQAKLLRVLESGEIQRVGSSKVRHVDVRVISATNAKLDEAVSEGRFREDLLYRLNTVEIQLPTLRERRADIPLLARHFLEREAERYDEAVEDFTEEALQALIRHPWPGNVRELEHAVERAVLMGGGGRIEAADLGLGLRGGGDSAVGLEGLTLDEIEKIMVEKALDRNDGNVTRAAEELGLSRPALYRRIDRYDLG